MTTNREEYIQKLYGQILIQSNFPQGQFSKNYFVTMQCSDSIFSIQTPKKVITKNEEENETNDDLNENENNFFQLTSSPFAKDDPHSDPRHRPVKRVRNEQNNDTYSTTNIDHFLAKLQDCENIKVGKLDQNKEFRRELRESEARLRLVKRGVPLYRTFKSTPQIYTPLTPKNRFHMIHEVIQKTPAKYAGVPPIRKIQFVYPYSARPQERIDLVSRINLSEEPRIKIKHARQRSQNLTLQYYNEMSNYLEYLNERRQEKAEVFFNDTAKYGIDKAQLNSKLNMKKSRLKIMSKADWWEDFIEHAFSNRTVSINEEKFIERVARHPNLTPSEFINLFKEYERNPKGKCLDWLKWINEKCNIINKITLQLMLEE